MIITTAYGYKINTDDFRYEYEDALKHWMASYGDIRAEGDTKEASTSNLLSNIYRADCK